jgi:hypothetical protein
MTKDQLRTAAEIGELLSHGGDRLGIVILSLVQEIVTLQETITPPGGSDGPVTHP